MMTTFSGACLTVPVVLYYVFIIVVVSAQSSSMSVVNAAGEKLVVGNQNLFWWNLFNQRGGGNFITVWRSLRPFDVMMFQECDDVRRILNDGGFPDREVIQERAVVIAWKMDRFEKIETGYEWVGRDRPEQFFGDRIIVYARLRDRDSGRHFLFANIHGPLPVSTGGVSGGEGLVRNIINAIDSHWLPGDAVVIGGDFNNDAGSATMRILNSHYTNIVSNWVDHVLTDFLSFSNVDARVISRDSTGSDHNGFRVEFTLGDAGDGGDGDGEDGNGHQQPQDNDDPPLPNVPCSEWGWRFLDGYDIEAQGISSEVAEHRNDCQPRCRSIDGCLAYSWAQGRCYYKDGADVWWFSR